MGGYNYSLDRSKSRSLSESSHFGVKGVTGASGAGGQGQRFSHFFKQKNKKSSRDLVLAKLVAKIQSRIDRLRIRGEKLSFSDLTSEFRFLLSKIRHLIDIVGVSVEPLNRVLYILGRSKNWSNLEDSMLHLVISKSDRIWLADWHAKSREMANILKRLHSIVTEQLNSVLMRVLSSYRKIIKVTSKQKTELADIFREIEDFKRSYDVDYYNFGGVLSSLDDVLSHSDLYLKVGNIGSKLGDISYCVEGSKRKYKKSKSSLKRHLRVVFRRMGIDSLTKKCQKLNQRGMGLLYGGGKEKTREIDVFLSEFSGYVEDLRSRLLEFEKQTLGHIDEGDPRLDDALDRCMQTSLGLLSSMSSVEKGLKKIRKPE